MADIDLTSAAHRAAAFALPDAVMARPTGVGSTLTAYDMSLEGRGRVLEPHARGAGHECQHEAASGHDLRRLRLVRPAEASG
jgi:hypothetical protein